jgi:alpha-L-rhamnosidase
MRVTLDRDPFAHPERGKTLWHRGNWPARWIAHPAPGQAPFVVAYRRHFRLTAEQTIRLHVSADERYALYLDGVLIGRGPERGDADHWFFETYETTMGAGPHVLVARVCTLGDARPTEPGEKPADCVASPLAQMALDHGFLLACDEAYLPFLATGLAAWEAKILPGYKFLPPGPAWGTGARIEVDGKSFGWNYHRGDGDGWVAATSKQPGIVEGRMEAGPAHILRPARLPSMIERYVNAGRVRHVDDSPGGRIDPVHDLPAEREELQKRRANRQPFSFEPRTRRRVLIDLENYFCAYPLLATAGGRGARVRVSWAESLFETPDPKERKKGDRNAIDGKFFMGIGDTFLPDGEQREFTTLWWEAGRYIEVLIETADQPLELNLILRETRYPLEMEGSFACPDQRIMSSVPILHRGLQMCAHETYLDCPYYEQLMYVGDARLEALCNYVISPDDRLARKAIEMFDVSRLPNGITQSRYPSRVRQIIPPFSLWWIGMVHDYAMWRGDKDFVRARMPGVRAVIEAYRSFCNADGLVEGPATGWNFVDWVPAWKNGVPPDAEAGASSVVNWQWILALRMAKELEEWFDEPELAARCDRLARQTAAAIEQTFWEPVRGLYADDAAKRNFSEHAQCLAILSGILDDDRARQVGAALLNNAELARTTIYFSHYLFEAYRALGGPAIPALFSRLQFWLDLKEKGFVTPMEEPEPSRSDCHGWGAHPLYHYFATVTGIRPAGFGFDTVEILPNLGELPFVKAKLPHARGWIEIELHREGNGVVRLPPEVSGKMVWQDGQIALKPGENPIT